jgi:GNAT superfamily N-acetyltransferase
MMGGMRIRKATMGDVAAVADLSIRLGEETGHGDLELQVVSRGVKAVVKDPHKGFYLLADQGGEAVGMMLVTKEWNDWRNQQYWWVTRAYVRERVRGSGVFSNLYRFLREMALSERGVAGLRLYLEGTDETTRAIYESLGLVRSAYDLYEDDLTWTE